MNGKITGWFVAVATAAAVSVLPASAGQQKQSGNHVQGQLVRADPSTGTVVVRTMDGNKAIDRMYKVETGTQFIGADRKPFLDGLTNKALRQGTDVWYQLGSGDKQSTITTLRLHDPSMSPPKMP